MADSLERTMRARVRLIRNEADMYDQVFYEPDETYTESTHQRVVLPVSMGSPAQVDMAGVTRAETLFLQTDREILVALHTSTRTWTVGEHGALMIVGNFTQLWLQNESSINQATVELVLTD